MKFKVNYKTRAKNMARKKAGIPAKGQIKRKIKKQVVPLYEKEGIGMIKNPKKATYNKAYNKTSFSIFDLFKKKK